MYLTPPSRSLLTLVAALGLASCGSDEVVVVEETATAPTPTPTPTEPAFVLLEDRIYGEGATQTGSVELLLDIYQPEATCTAPRPTVFYVHGGAFAIGDKQDQIVEALAPLIVEEGLNFVSINYRLSGDMPVFSEEYAQFGQDLIDDGIVSDPDGDLYPAIVSAIEDGVTALRWMEDNAEEFCFDMSRMGYWGSSAGTIITAQIAYSLNPYEIARPEPLFVNAWWGELFRPEDLEAGEAPFLILHGDEDPVVDYQVSLDLAAQADSVEVPYAFYTLVGAEHGFDINNTNQTQAGFDVSVDFAVA
ncbi:MAG: alpha/beta hydrolase, partial [Pseudomonadota bacterium]